MEGWEVGSSLCKQAGGKGFCMRVEFGVFGYLVRFEFWKPRYSVYVGLEKQETFVLGFYSYRGAVNYCVGEVTRRSYGSPEQRFFGFVRDN